MLGSWPQQFECFLKCETQSKSADKTKVLNMFLKCGRNSVDIGSRKNMIFQLIEFWQNYSFSIEELEAFFLDHINNLDLIRPICELIQGDFQNELPFSNHFFLKAILIYVQDSVHQWKKSQRVSEEKLWKNISENLDKHSDNSRNKIIIPNISISSNIEVLIHTIFFFKNAKNYYIFFQKGHHYFYMWTFLF